MMGPLLALTVNGFREARRNRVTVVVGLFALALVVFSGLLTNLALSTFDRVLTDMGLGVMSIMLVLLAVFLSSGMLTREIERRTLFLVVSKPIPRGLFLLGRFAGNMLTLLVLLIVMTVVFVIAVKIYSLTGEVTRSQLTAIVMLFFELLILSSIGFMMSSFASQMVAATVTASMYFAGHLSGDIYELGLKAGEGPLRAMATAVYYALPNLSRVNFRPQATYEIDTPIPELLAAGGYAVGYSVVMLALAVIFFQRRDFK